MYKKNKKDKKNNSNKNKIIKKCAISLLSIVCATHVLAMHERAHVNVLTWWGYLDHSGIIDAAERACHVKISYDEYYSNDEFLRRWHNPYHQYDIIIFSKTIYNLVKHNIKQINTSRLWQQANLYHPIIKKKYLEYQFPHNIVFFAHALTGFLYNKNNIALSAEDSILAIFKKAADHLVIVIDDPVEAKKLVHLGYRNSDLENNEFTVDTFKKLVQSARIYIGNGFSRIYQDSQFAFSFAWSGEAIHRLNGLGPKFKFLVHPQLSYISSDLLAMVDDRSGSECVAKYLTSKATLDKIQNHNYYFSSYTEFDQRMKFKNPGYYEIYRQFLGMLPHLNWIQPIDAQSFDKVQQSWEYIKFDLNKNKLLNR